MLDCINYLQQIPKQIVKNLWVMVTLLMELNPV